MSEKKSESKPVAASDTDQADKLPKFEQAKSIIKRNVLWSLGAGLLPTPLLDMAGITAVQCKMIKELSDLYNIEFKDTVVRSTIASLLAGMGSTAIGMRLGASLAKIIPVVGTAIGSVAVPATGGATTYAVGRVFVMHFETGGTLLDFDPAKMKGYFAELYSEGKQVVKDLKTKETKEPETSPESVKASA